MEERPILVIFKVCIKLVVPNDARGSVHIHQFEMEHTARLILDKRDGTLQACVRPFIGIRVSVIDPCRRDVKDIV